MVSDKDEVIVDNENSGKVLTLNDRMFNFTFLNPYRKLFPTADVKFMWFVGLQQPAYWDGAIPVGT